MAVTVTLPGLIGVSVFALIVAIAVSELEKAQRPEEFEVGDARVIVFC